MMQSIALSPTFRGGDRPGPAVRSRATAGSRPRPVATGPALSPAASAIVDLDDPRDGVRTIVLTLVAAALVAFVLAMVLFASAANAATADAESITPIRSTVHTVPTFASAAPTVSIPTGPALFVMLAQGQD